MFTQFYSLDFITTGFLNLTNVYKNLWIENNSSYEISVFYRNILICKIPSFASITLENVFNSNTKKQFDENVQLKFTANSSVSTNIKLLNYGV